MKKTAAFTLIEILLSISLIALIGGMSTMINAGAINRMQADAAQEDVGHSLRKAQLNAKMTKGNNNWGVRISSNSVTTFMGNSYATRNTGYDEITTYDSKTVLSIPSGPSEVVFTKVTGVASSGFNVNINSTNGLIKTVVFTQSGGITYN